MKSILILQGPNLNLLGRREPEVYGKETLEDIHTRLEIEADALALKVSFFQSNHEGSLVDRIQKLMEEPVDWVIINPAAFTHTSIALRDSLLAVNIPFIELHLSNVHSRESFRHHSYFSDKAHAVIVGLGSFGYTAALRFIANTS